MSTPDEPIPPARPPDSPEPDGQTAAEGGRSAPDDARQAYGQPRYGQPYAPPYPEQPHDQPQYPQQYQQYPQQYQQYPQNYQQPYQQPYPQPPHGQPQYQQYGYGQQQAYQHPQTYVPPITPTGGGYQPAGYPPAGAQGQAYSQPTYPQSGFDTAAGGRAPIAESPSKKSPAGVIVGLILLVVVLVAAAVVLFWQPGYLNSTVFDRSAVEQGVTTILTNAPSDDPAGYGLDGIADVSCPTGVEVRASDTFTCTLTQDGAPKSVTNTIVDDSGTYQVGLPE